MVKRQRFSNKLDDLHYQADSVSDQIKDLVRVLQELAELIDKALKEL